ncbi:SIMPL domain-containing protein [Rhizobium sp. TRM95796]|uniref:SIMPL domain-containing protein n=1 Tax=Rhizobium sp. TRM95796 TaxID=2979862 RepID=UPI0021E7B54B|nr:SIMPL domain-containing protein [Rhizobium sp. TRM95796]MCV3764694.1 SIMPL domain-containing protein [Rhizobium sp. TRM95796]
MPRLSMKILSVAALGALSVAAALPAVAVAQDAVAARPAISVSGEATAALVPDMALVNLAVVRTEATARAALDGSNKAMADVLDAMKKAGVSERDLQTSGFFIQPQYDYSGENNGGPPKLMGYQVGNTLTVRLRDLSKLGVLLDTAVTLGVNQGGDIRFLNDKPEAAIDKARAEAVRDALAKAKILAEAAGVGLGEVLEIADNAAVSEPVPMARMAMAAKESADAVPVAAGENTYRASVSVKIAIKPKP